MAGTGSERVLSLFTGLLSSTHDHVAIKDLDGRYVFVNDACAEWFGLPVDSIIGRRNAELWGEAKAEAVAEHDRPLLLHGQRMEYEEELVLDGAPRTWLTTKDVIRDAAGRIIAYGSVSREITDRVAAERARVRSDEALRQNLRLLNGILDATADHISVKDADGRYLLVNRAYADWFGATPEAMVGRTYEELHANEDGSATTDRDRELIASGVPMTYEEAITRNGATCTWLTNRDVIRDASDRIVATFAISQEVTELRRIEAQSQQAQKMEAVGQLAGGIAHDFNNMLTAIRGYAELVRARLPEDLGEDRADLEQVTRAADRAAELVRQLLAFSRRQVLSPRVVDPGAIVSGIAPLLRRLLGEHVEIEVRRAVGLGKVLVDQNQLEQVVVNLAVNAGDAMPDGGRLTIEAANAELDAEFARLHPWAEPGPHVVLTVSDTGVGMEPGTVAHIFEPFFTTKEVGRGTGMGLATVFGIVRQSGGSIDVATEPGHGATFRIYLPRVVDEQAIPVPAVPATRPTGVGTETVLLVEDEPGVREFARRSLERRGYRVLEAARGDEALAVAEAFGERIDVLVTDAIMPGLQGHQLAERLAASRPGVRVLLVSGYTEEAVSQPGPTPRDRAFLAKPFTGEALCEAVRRLLDGRD